MQSVVFGRMQSVAFSRMHYVTLEQEQSVAFYQLHIDRGQHDIALCHPVFN